MAVVEAAMRAILAAVEASATGQFLRRLHVHHNINFWSYLLHFVDFFL